MVALELITILVCATAFLTLNTRTFVCRHTGRRIARRWSMQIPAGVNAIRISAVAVTFA
jgi:hypothetical protein